MHEMMSLTIDIILSVNVRNNVGENKGIELAVLFGQSVSVRLVDQVE